jgi:hypothetical protein
MKFAKISLLTVIASITLSCNSQSSSAEKFQYNPAELKKPDDFFRNKAAIAMKDGKWGWINPFGEWVVKPEYEEASEQWALGLTVMKKDGKFGVVNTKNEVVYPFEFDKIYLDNGTGNPHNGPYITFIKGEEKTYRDFDGNVIDEPSQFWLRNNSFLFTSKIPHSYATEIDFEVVNEKGETQLDFKKVPFSCWIGEFREGYAPFFIGKFNDRAASGIDGYTYYGFVNEAGEMVIEPQYIANEITMRGDEKDFTNPNFYFKNGEVLVHDGEKFYAINTKGEILREYSKDYYQIEPANSTGIRKAGIYSLNANGEVIHATGEGDWDLNYQFNDNGFGVQKNAKEKRYRVVNEKLKEIYSLPFWDEEYYYEITPDWYQQDKYFTVSRVSIADMKAAGVESIYDSPKHLYEFKKVTYDLAETDWMPYMENWVPILGVTAHHDEETDMTTVIDLNNKEVFTAKGRLATYLGGDQNNYRNQWLFKFWRDRSEVHIGITGCDFTNELERYDHRFMDIDHRLFQEDRTDENPNFTLKFTEEDVARYYQNLPKNK